MMPIDRLRRRLASEDGFTMLFALLALFVGTLLVAAAFSSANGDIKLTKQANLQARAYYAAVAGIERYQYQITANPNFWIECPHAENLPVTGASTEKYAYKTLGSSKSPNGCEANKQTSILETSGNANGTFRVLSTGTVEYGGTKVERKIVATFAHPGFTKYVYESNYELEDPANFEPEPTYCEHYYKYRVEHSLTGKCPPIEFAPEDVVNGPMHTNDAASVCSEGTKKPTFGRNSEDSIEMVEGHYAYPSGSCGNSPNIVGKYTEGGGTLLPPETDAELLESAGLKLTGRTVIKLKAGVPNTMEVETEESGGKMSAPTTKTFPSNGVVYVQNASTGCGIKYNPFNSDTEDDYGCGNVYVSGEYNESLTIASGNDVIVNGNLKTTSSSTSSPVGEPTGGATLGLIAENFVRIYHPVKHGYKPLSYEPKTYTPTSTEISHEFCGTYTTKSAKTTSSSAEVTMSSTTGLEKGMEVTGTGIRSGSTIESVKNSTTIVLSKTAEKSQTSVTLTFTKGNGYEYNATQKKCIEEGKNEYSYYESENLWVKECESGTKYVGNVFCEYENMTSSSCTSKANNQNSTEDPNKWGYMNEPEIDAAILSTKHSLIVDNWKCGSKMGKLTIWGSIAQFWRGPVGTGGGTGGSGYIKNYNYDERLASQQPPSFLSPSSTSWSLSRETAPPTSFCESKKC